MGNRGWIAVWLTAMIVAMTPGAGAAVQYDDGLPAGLLEIEVGDQPIDASTTPRIEGNNPRFVGRVVAGVPTIELGLGNGEITRFTVEVNERSGRFRTRPPEPLASGTYSLYVNDALVGEFIIVGDEDEDEPAADGTPRPRRAEPLLDLARVVPFPRDVPDAIPALAVLDARYYTLEQEARRAALEAGDASREAIRQTEAALADAGWQQRYESRLASPREDDPDQFERQVSTFVYEYDSADSAQTAFEAVTGGEEGTEEIATIGDVSRVTSVDGVTPDTGAAYQASRLIFREDRVLVVMVVADLLNREVEAATIEALGQAVQARAAAVIAGELGGLGVEPARMDVGTADAFAVFEAYGLIDAEVVPFYTEDAETRAAREASYAGATDGYTAFFSATIEPERQRRNATPEAGAGEESLTYDISIYRFADEEEAATWLAGLGERLTQDPLPGYLAFAPVADSESYGDASETYSFRLRSASGTEDGFRVYVQVGDEIAAVELSATTEPSLETVDELVRAQVRCLERDTCPDTIEIPALTAEEDGPVEEDDASEAG